MSESITLEHGSGGALSRELVEEVILPCLGVPSTAELEDAAAIGAMGPARFTTDTYVVDPPLFPGGDIGRLAVFGTCNDLAVSGARARFLSLALVLEEGLALATLRAALESAAAAAAEAGVAIVTGDTKVVPAGRGGGIFVNTAGVGEEIFHGLARARVRPGDCLVVSGPLGAHGIAVLAAREGLPVGSTVRSDCALLFPLVELLFTLGPGLRFCRDATRGGLAAVANEICRGMSIGMTVREGAVPADPTVEAVADTLGLSTLEIANEGVLVAVVAAEAARAAVTALRGHPRGASAAVAGEVTTDAGRVTLETRIGGRRLLGLPRGLLLPRIC